MQNPYSPPQSPLDLTSVGENNSGGGRALYLGVKGRELAWRNKRWESLEYFNQVQRRWSFWGVIIVVGTAAMGFIAGIAVPAYQQYVHRHGGG